MSLEVKMEIIVFLLDGEFGSRDIYQNLQRGPKRTGGLWTCAPNGSSLESAGPGPPELL